MRNFYDCEFLEDGRTIELISIGIVAEDGREYYAVNSDMPIDRIREHDWLSRNVLPHLPVTNRTSLDRFLAHSPNVLPCPSIGSVDIDRSALCVKPQWVIANEVRAFLTHDLADEERAELWAYYGAYDHVTLAQLWGPMIRLPEGLPMWTHELMQLWELAGRPEMPPRPENAHDALADARWNRALFGVCNQAIAEASYRPRHTVGEHANRVTVAVQPPDPQVRYVPVPVERGMLA